VCACNFLIPHNKHTHLIATPFGILPTLEFDGKWLGGNAAIARYLAEKHGESFARF